MDSKEVLQSSIKAASYNIVLQVLFRIITFVLNAFVLHYVDISVLGLLNVRLYLLFSTILFVSREAFRRACQSCSSSHDWRKVINLLWLTVPNTILWSTVFCWIWLNLLAWPEGEELASKYRFSVYAIGFSAVLESFFEPVYVFSQAFMFIRLRVVIDSVGMIIRCVGLATTVAINPAYAVEATVFGQVTVSFVYAIGFYGYFAYEFARRKKTDEPALPLTQLSDFLPKVVQNESTFDRDLAQLVGSFFVQGLMKQALTEGERYLMTITTFLSMAEQGVYDIVNNLGSMAVRFILLPVEESSYFYFTKMLKREEPLEKQDQALVKESSNVLRILVRCMALLGMASVCFGLPYARTILFLYGGKSLAEGVGPVLMKLNFVLILLFAVNGVTEGYATATVSKKDLDKNSAFMVVTSVIYLVSALAFVSSISSPGLILANGLTMSLRIARSCYLIQRQYSSTPYSPLTESFPKPREVAVLVLTFAIGAWSEMANSLIVHLGVGLACGLFFVATVLTTEPEVVKFLASKLLRLREKVE